VEQETPLFGGIKFRYDMDKVDRINRLVESSLDTSFGGDIQIVSLMVLPTQKFFEGTNTWVPDSYSLFVQIRKGSVVLNRPGEVEFFLESLFGFESCVDFV
jgi:hypothetical protein